MSKPKAKRATKISPEQTETPTPTSQDSTHAINGNGTPSAASLAAPHQNNGSSAGPVIPGLNAASLLAKGANGFDLTDKIKELVRLSQEQGYLTYNDINEALPDHLTGPEELDEIYVKLRSLEVEIVDQAEVDRIKQPVHEEEDEKTRLDILDDPVRMYLKQMGQVPLLTREQEVEISKRIEEAENQVKQLIYGFGFAAKEHIALAEKLISEPPKERFDRVILDKKINSRESHLTALRKLVKTTREWDAEVDTFYAEWQKGVDGDQAEALESRFRKADRKLQ
jgi:RNA polymerase primary sigma factor